MSDLVEKVARAICATRFNTRNVHEWDELPEDFKALYLADARAKAGKGEG